MDGQLTGAVPDSVLQERSTANQDFLQRFDMKVDNGRVIGGGDSDRQRDRLVREKWAQLYAIGWDTVTIVNCLAWPLELHTSFGYFKVPAPDRRKGEAFHTYEVRVPSIDMRDLGDGKFVPEVVMPSEIASDFAKKYQDEGGVFWFKGTEKPANLGEQLENARGRTVQWMKAKKLLGDANWARYNKNPYFIDDRMRDAARFLHENNLIDNLPEWISLTRDEAINAECEACGETVKKAAKICKHCGYHIDAQFVAANRARLGIEEKVSTEPTPDPEPSTLGAHKKKG